MKQQGYPRVIWLLAIGMAINVTGNSFLWPLNTIYITEVLGKSMTISGIVLMLQQGIGIIGNLIGGWLFDIQGAKRTIIIGIIFSVASVFSLSFITKFEFYVLLMMLLGFSNGLIFPSMYAMAGSLWPEGGRRAFNIVYVSQNLGVAIGSTLGGLIALISFKLIFLINASTFILFLLLILFGFKGSDWEKARSQSIQQRPDISITEAKATNQRNFVALLIMSFAFVLTWMPYVQWQTSISKYISSLGITLSQYTVLWTINGALIVLGQPFIALMTRTFINTTKKQMLYGIVIFLVSFVVLYNNTMYYGFIIAMSVMTIGEMLVWPAVPAAAAELAPKGKSGLYQGVVSSSGAAGRMLGFLIGGFLYDSTEMNNVILIMLGLFIISGFAFMVYDQGLKGKEKQLLH